MERKTQIFISYKTGINDGLTATANAIRKDLETNGYEVWMDKSAVVPGEDWDTQIYEALSKTDVVVLLLAPPTAKSDWVRREIDVARGAQVFVLPVVIRDGFDFGEALDQFAIPRKQAIKVLELSDDETKKLRDSIEQNKDKTRDRQEKWLAAMRSGSDKPVFKEAHTPPEKSIAVFSLRGYPSRCKIHVAGGDITSMNGIDVLVNAENNYMQMARIFESSSLSSKLRLRGSQTNKAGHIKEDTVQYELYDQIAEDYPIPLNPGIVVPTHAGHPDSILVKTNKARYIFHCVTVTVQAKENAVYPIDNENIKDAIVNCLDKVIEVDRSHGLISPKHSERYMEEESTKDAHKPIESIVLPLFGTGRGGREREINQVANSMLIAIRDYLTTHSDDEELKLKAIYVCGFSDLDVKIINEEMNKIFQKTS